MARRRTIKSSHREARAAFNKAKKLVAAGARCETIYFALAEAREHQGAALGLGADRDEGEHLKNEILSGEAGQEYRSACHRRR